MLQCFGNSDSLEGMKQTLRDLDKIKLIRPDDIAILDLKRTLKAKIAERERQKLSSVEAVQEMRAV